MKSSCCVEGVRLVIFANFWSQLFWSCSQGQSKVKPGVFVEWIGKGMWGTVGGWELDCFRFYPRTEFSFSLVNLNLFCWPWRMGGKGGSPQINLQEMLVLHSWGKKNNSGGWEGRAKEQLLQSGEVQLWKSWRKGSEGPWGTLKMEILNSRRDCSSWWIASWCLPIPTGHHLKAAHREARYALSQVG